MSQSWVHFPGKCHTSVVFEVCAHEVNPTKILAWKPQAYSELPHFLKNAEKTEKYAKEPNVKKKKKKAVYS